MVPLYHVNTIGAWSRLLRTSFRLTTKAAPIGNNFFSLKLQSQVLNKKIKNQQNTISTFKKLKRAKYIIKMYAHVQFYYWVCTMSMDPFDIDAEAN